MQHNPQLVETAHVSVSLDDMNEMAGRHYLNEVVNEKMTPEFDQQGEGRSPGSQIVEVPLLAFSTEQVKKMMLQTRDQAY